MCGVTGIVGPGAKGDRVRQMRGCQTHRGPDGRGGWVGDNVALGHARLAVIDLSEAGRQPMWTPDGRWGLVFNGEVYNFRSLRDRLRKRNHSFRSRTDTEVVLHAWAEWGEEALARLEGMFAFGLWDRRERRLLLARDRMGVKPLYWARTEEQTLVFASEVKALLASGLLRRRLARRILPAFLAQQTTPTPETLIDGVRMLPAGSWMTVDLKDGLASRPDVQRYWHPLDAAARRRNGRGQHPSPSEMIEGIGNRLQAAVGKRLVADVPLGAFLSGGIDSTAVVALMASCSDECVRTFTVAFEDDRFQDDAYARLAAQELSTDHREVRLSEDELIERVPAAVNDQDHPSGDGINTWIVAQAAREAGLTVALSGLGGDELFGGYPSFRQWQTLERAQPLLGLPNWVKHSVGRIIRRFGSGVALEKITDLLRTDGSVPEVYPVLRQVFGRNRRLALLQDGLGANGAASTWGKRLRSDFRTHPSTPSLAKIAHAEASCYMRDVLLRDTDQMSMAHSLEVRVPLLDHELVEYVFSLPDEVREPSASPKRYLAGALGSRLPEPVTNRAKAGFAMPFDRWMRGPLREFCSRGIEATAAHAAFKGEAVNEVWKGFLDHAPELTWSRPWLLVALGHWLEREQVE